jgi:PiT family inorganic phosphate transporter
MNIDASAVAAERPAVGPRLDYKAGPGTAIIFIGLLVAGVLFTGFSLTSDVSQAQIKVASIASYLLLAGALLIALGFEFVNGFHDTANAVATVIYTHSLPAQMAVLWSGLFNFLGVLVSSGAVAFGIISLLPVELILQVGSGAGFAMVFALLIAAIVWNLGTWTLGLPASSSHTLIGSIVGVGVANALMHGRDGTSGVDWSQVTKVGESLLLSPLVGFLASALLFLAMKAVIKNRKLFEAPRNNAPPPWWIRGLLVLTCTGVSFAHGSNDGQKGMGLIMLILVGTVPLAYALNRAMPADQVAQFAAVAEATHLSLARNLPSPAPPASSPEEARETLSVYVRTHQYSPVVLAALSDISGSIGDQVKGSEGSLGRIRSAVVPNVRNDMYLTSEAIRLIQKDKQVGLDSIASSNIKRFKTQIDAATKFIPMWVKVAVAIALGLGTMIGWKRIVVTVGEKIGKTHLTYAQGASAELVAMLTIGAADSFGLPVSTTHVLSSGVAGTMSAAGSGLQMATVRNLLLAWVLTLPAAILLSASLYWVLSHVF